MGETKLKLSEAIEVYSALHGILGAVDGKTIKTLQELTGKLKHLEEENDLLQKQLGRT